MQHQEKFQSPLFSGIGAVFLLLIFLAVPMIEAFHHHINFELKTLNSWQPHRQTTGSAVHLADGNTITVTALAKQAGGWEKYDSNQLNTQKSFTASAEKCKLCELMKHHFHHFYIPVPPVSEPVAWSVKKTAPFFLLQSSSAFLLQCANKGPPTVA